VQNETVQLQELADHYPDAIGEISAGANERARARAAISALMKILHRVDLDAGAGRFAEAAGEYLNYRKLTFAAAALALQAAEPWSLFDPTLHAAHQSALPRAMRVKTAGP
jgi:hypothetical protein